jgi:serine/threonine protein kinase
MLRSSDGELRDLAHDRPELVEAFSGRRTGVRLVSCLGCGGMSTVFLGELDPAQRSVDLSELTPRRLALKFLQASTYEHFRRMNHDPSDVFLREVVALSRMMEHQPPTEFVVSFYGSGHADVDVKGTVRRLPWLALELVEGGAAGGSLAERVERSGADGIDPVRALRLIRGIFEGVAALHSEGIIHRDLKPDNVLVAGPVDDESPKVADCGIARVDGLMATIAGMTPAYGAPEQVFSSAGVRNPLIGPWTDMHALAAVFWFLIGGGDWCRGETDPAWNRGERRSLRTAPRVHRGFMVEPTLLDQLDAVFARGASPRLPQQAVTGRAANDADQLIRFFPAIAAAPDRYASVEEFRGALLPVLERFAAAWSSRATVENRAATAFRPTQLRAVPAGFDGPSAVVRAMTPARTLVATDAGLCVFQPDGRVLARFGEELVYFIDEQPRRVAIPDNFRERVASSRWLTRGPGGGFALVGASHIVLVRGGVFSTMPAPSRGSAEVGPIEAIVDDGRVFGVVTAETDDSNGGPELWRSADGVGWDEPVVLPLGGVAKSVAYGPYGFFVVGARREQRARALFLGFDNQPVVFVVGVNDRPPLLTAVCSAGRESWAAGVGFLLAFDRGTVVEESIETDEAPVTMSLDIVGVPWLVTSQNVLRRHVESGRAIWRSYHRRKNAEPPFVGIGFTPEGARVLDARGGGVHLTPHDVEAWRARSGVTLARPA